MPNTGPLVRHIHASGAIHTWGLQVALIPKISQRSKIVDGLNLQPKLVIWTVTALVPAKTNTLPTHRVNNRIWLLTSTLHSNGFFRPSIEGAIWAHTHKNLTIVNWIWLNEMIVAARNVFKCQKASCSHHLPKLSFSGRSMSEHPKIECMWIPDYSPYGIPCSFHPHLPSA